MQLVQRVVGHEITGVGITKLYTSEFELKDMVDCLSCYSLAEIVYIVYR